MPPVHSKTDMHSDSGRIEGTPQGSEILELLPVEVIFQHMGHDTASIFNVEFPTNAVVEQLKQDMAPRLRTPPECQDWYYKGRKMAESDSLYSLGIKRDDKILIKEITARGVKLKEPTSEEHKKSEASSSQ